MHTWADIQGQTLWPLPRGLRVLVRPASAPNAVSPELIGAMEERWRLMCAENPRLHDGPLLQVDEIDAGGGVVLASRGSFKPMAAQSAGLELGVFGLGVKGLLIGRDRRGRAHALIARRGSQTRVYQGQWEIAPAGGVEPPPMPAHGRERGGARAEAREWVEPVTTELGEQAVREALCVEAEEELGLTLAPEGLRAVAIVRDAVAHSCDVIVRGDWPGVIDPRAGLCTRGCAAWEYVDSAWLALDELGAFERDNPGAMVGPARAALRWFATTAARAELG